MVSLLINFFVNLKGRKSHKVTQRQRKENSSFILIQSQISAISGLGPGQSQEPGTKSRFPDGWQGFTYCLTLPLLGIFPSRKLSGPKVSR